jgi:hypothetical protein
LRDDSFTTGVNQAIQINVLANDTIGGQTNIQFTQPQHGTIQTGAPGLVYYQPDQNYIGIDKFNYVACLGNNCLTGLVTITVTDSAVTCNLSAANDSLLISPAVSQTVPFSIKILQNDNACNATPIIIQQPIHGQAYINPNNKELIYTRPSNFSGQDVIIYQLSNGSNSVTASVKINMYQPSCTLQANLDTVTMIRHFGAVDTVTAKVLANDTWCPNGTTPTVQVIYQPYYGGYSIIGTGPNTRIKYITAQAPKNVTDKIRYRICQTINNQQVCSDSEMQIRIR